ncbi:Hypothetical predicted protein, partial [Marmota monax]
VIEARGKHRSDVLEGANTLNHSHKLQLQCSQAANHLGLLTLDEEYGSEETPKPEMEPPDDANGDIQRVLAGSCGEDTLGRETELLLLSQAPPWFCKTVKEHEAS